MADNVLAAGTTSAEEIGQPQVDDGVKRRQVLEGAREVFMSAGFDAGSMNDIARAAGVSKGTLYAYFDSKVALFEALIREDRGHQPERNTMFPADEPDPAKALAIYGRALVGRVARVGHPDPGARGRLRRGEISAPRPDVLRGWSPVRRASNPACAASFAEFAK